MSSLLDLVRRSAAAAWRDGDKIPWHEATFSRRMLTEHLTHDHDLASRRAEFIDAHVDWIREHLLTRGPAKILDLGCGPGLYTSRLAQRGHECLGIDYAPAAIDYARAEAHQLKVRCTYRRQDIRSASYGTGFNLVMLIFGEFNTFHPGDANIILRKAHRALADGGLLLLEPHTYEAVRASSRRQRSWYSADHGLFSDKPHLCLQEHSWHADANAATVRYFIVDAATGEVCTHAGSQQAYSDDDYRAVLRDCGFNEVEFFPALTSATNQSMSDLMVIVSRKSGVRSNP